MFTKNNRLLTLRGIGYLVFAYCLTILAACDKTDSIGLGQANNLSAVITDTSTVSTSTYLLDSIPTAGTGLQIGHVSDPSLGTIAAQTYFQLAPENAAPASLPDDATLDSTGLKLKYSGFYYGDTSQTQNISVHQLTQQIILNTGNGIQEPEEQNVFTSTPTFYNVSKVPYNSQAIGSLTFKPKPTSKDTLLIPINNTVGANLFQMVRDADIKILNTDEFLGYFKGLTIKSSNSGNSIIGYTDTVQLKLYYHYTGTDGLRKNGQMTFALYNTAYQFNNISADRTGTLLQSISPTNREIKATSSNGNTFIQGGIGLVTRINLPYLSYLSEKERTAINKAELIIEVEPLTERTFSLPSNLVLLVANKYAKPTSVLSDPMTNTSSLPLRASNTSAEKYYYSFPLTEYVSQSYRTYNNTTLFLSLPVSDLGKSFSRAILGSPENYKASVKLKITYTNLNL